MRHPRPTRRGVVLAAVAVASIAMGVRFGVRALDAVVLPAGVALVAAAVQLYALDPPRVERTVPPAGGPGATGTVELTFRTDTPVTAVVSDRLPAGVDGEATTTAHVGGDPVTYEVTYRERGVHQVGPATVSARDVLGLARRSFVADGRDAVVVYPRVYHPSAAVGERLLGLTATDAGVDRGAFDHLREYIRGDSLRDVHWKSSAKRDALVVQEFGGEDDSRTVTMAASADAGSADAMAEAAATVGCALLWAGVGVSLTTPDARLHLSPGAAEDLLSHLARVDDGDAAADAEVVVDATADGTTVAIDGATLPFDPDSGRRVGRRVDGRGSADGQRQSSGSTTTAGRSGVRA
jgi:uncharacterized protein (DUF58 family)